MRVKVAGIVHFDPLCRGRLYGWLQDLLRSHSSPPAFVAVEWDEQHFKEVKKQRPIIRSLAQSKWPNATDEFYNTLKLTAAFEADTHVSLLPNTQIIWLDQGQSLPNAGAIINYSPTQIDIYKKCILPNTTEFDSVLLKTMSKKAWKIPEPPEKGGTDRDRLFADAIIKKSGLEPSAWSIAVVGADHGSRDSGYMVALLEEAGITCDVTVLCPTPEIGANWKTGEAI